ncbi:hypothetical protein SNEBB_004349 [Seison nebaliae]|nr:hypothetical protein SNEBB_004349 [Seison nebaliae]
MIRSILLKNLVTLRSQLILFADIRTNEDLVRCLPNFNKILTDGIHNVKSFENLLRLENRVLLELNHKRAIYSPKICKLLQRGAYFIIAFGINKYLSIIRSDDIKDEIDILMKNFESNKLRTKNIYPKNKINIIPIRNNSNVLGILNNQYGSQPVFLAQAKVTEKLKRNYKDQSINERLEQTCKLGDSCGQSELPTDDTSFESVDFDIFNSIDKECKMRRIVSEDVGKDCRKIAERYREINARTVMNQGISHDKNYKEYVNLVKNVENTDISHIPEQTIVGNLVQSVSTNDVIHIPNGIYDEKPSNVSNENSRQCVSRKRNVSGFTYYPSTGWNKVSDSCVMKKINNRQ